MSGSAVFGRNARNLWQESQAELLVADNCLFIRALVDCVLSNETSIGALGNGTYELGAKAESTKNDGKSNWFEFQVDSDSYIAMFTMEANSKLKPFKPEVTSLQSCLTFLEEQGQVSVALPNHTVERKQPASGESGQRSPKPHF